MQAFSPILLNILKLIFDIYFKCAQNVSWNTPVEQPSRSSFLTGVRPDATGVYDLATSFRDRLGPGAVTLPGYFKAHGYATQAVGKVFHGNLDDASSWTVPWQPCDRPTYYTEADEPVAAASAASGTLRMGDTLAETLGPAAVCSAPALGSAPVVDAFFRDGAIALAAVRALHNLTEAAAVSPESSSSASVSGDNEQINPKPPFFLAVGFTKPHLPFVAPEKYVAPLSPLIEVTSYIFAKHFHHTFHILNPLF